MSLSPDQKLAAYFLGRRIAGQRRKQDRVPVAYLYNGVRLPGLPEWDRENYPFACICRTWTGNYAFSASQSPPYMFDSTYGIALQIVGSHFISFGDAESGWSELRAQVEDYSILMAYEDNHEIFVWANHDIEYNGELFVSASEPVPVYE